MEWSSTRVAETASGRRALIGWADEGVRPSMDAGYSNSESPFTDAYGVVRLDYSTRQTANVPFE